MSQSPKPRGLGRGLSALLGDEEIVATVAPSPLEAPSSQTPSRPPLTLPIGRLKPGKMQPRTTFEDLDALVDSVKEFGLLQPILVRPVAGQSDVYEIVAGERRWRAAQRAQLHEVPVVVRSMDDRDALQVGLIENLQRADLTAIDEAQAYRRLVEDFKQSHDEIGKTVGKSRPHVANTVRLLELPGAVHEMIRKGQLSAGQARALVGLPDPLVMAERALQEQLTVRASRASRGRARPSRRSPRAPTPGRWRSASRRPWASRPSSSCAGWASRACSPWRSAISTSSMPSSIG
jgi:ParB family chromosome partitioning protein